MCEQVCLPGHGPIAVSLCVNRCAYLDMGQAQTMMKQWSLEMDTALVSLVNELCRSLAVSSSRLHAHELILTEVQLASQQYTCLHSKSV